MHKVILVGIQTLLGMILGITCFYLGLINLVTIIIFIAMISTLIATKYKIAPIVFLLTYLCLFIYFILTFKIGPFF